jgi:hypothetical protein
LTVRFERVVGDTTYDRRHKNQATSVVIVIVIVVVVFVLPAATGRPPALLLRLQLLLHVVISSHNLSHFLCHVYRQSQTMQILAGSFSFLTVRPPRLRPKTGTAAVVARPRRRRPHLPHLPILLPD